MADASAGGAVVAGQLGLGVADLAQAGAEAAQVLGHGQGQVAALAHGVVRLGHEGGVAVVVGRVLGRHLADLARRGARTRSSSGRTGVG